MNIISGIGVGYKKILGAYGKILGTEDDGDGWINVIAAASRCEGCGIEEVSERNILYGC